MGIVAGFRIQDGLPEQFGREHGVRKAQVIASFFSLVVRVADIDAAAVFHIDLAPGREDVDRVRNGHQKAGFKEVRQEFMVQGDPDLMIAVHFHAAQGEGVRVFTVAEDQLFVVEDLRAGLDVLVVAQKVLGAVDLAADRLDFGAHHQQDGERVIPRRDGRAVGIHQVVPQQELKDFVSILIQLNPILFHDAGVDHIGTLILVPVDQVVAVDQGADVDIGRVVAEQLGKEVALGDRGVSDDQFFREFRFVLSLGCRGFFRVSKVVALRQRRQGRGSQEKQGKEQAQEFLQFGHVDQILPSYSIRWFYPILWAPAAPAHIISASVISRSSRPHD